MEIKKSKDGWWLSDPYNGQYPEYGPYSTKAEALQARKGMMIFYRLNPEAKVENEFSEIPQPDPDNWEHAVDRIEPDWKGKGKKK